MALLDNNIKQLPGAKKALGQSLAFSVVDAFLTAGQSLCLAMALTHLWEGGAAVLASQVGLIAGFLGCFVCRQLVAYLRESLLDAFSRETATRLRLQLAQHLYDCGPTVVARKGRAALVTTLIEGCDQVRTYVALIIPKVTDLMVIPSVLAVTILVLDPLSGVISVALIPCIVFYMRMLGSYAKENAAKQHDKFQRMANHFADSLQGMSTLKIFGRSRAYALTMHDTSESFREATAKTLKSATLSSLVLDLFRVFALAAVAILLGFRLMSADIALFPALMVLILVPDFFVPVRRYSTDFHASLDGRNQLQAVLDVLNVPPEQDCCALPEGDVGAPHLKVGAVSFSYDVAGHQHQALQQVSFEAKGPLKVGVIGASGSGKSTLAQLLAGFSSPDEGTFTVDGVATPSLAGPAWRHRVTYIPQNPHIFYGTLRENIVFYCPQASEQAILDAVRRAGLDELLAELPQGLDTVVGEGGRSLSGGQAQRIALARGFLDASRSVLVFDEPTAHLDIETELALKERIVPLMEGRLVFFCTHRLHWMQDMDLILVLERGKLVEQGTLEQLRTQNGAFVRLSAQLSGGDL